MPPLYGWRVRILEARKSAELAELVRRFGGTPISAPAVHETPRLGDVAAFLDSLETGRFSTVVFLTGAGAMVIFGEAERRGRLPQALEALRNTRTVCRGPKPAAVLNRYAVPVQLAVAKPFTTNELLEALAPVDISGRDMALVHYGERNAALSVALKARGAHLTEVCPYEWTLPEDVEPLRALVREATAHRLDAVAFTSQIQVRHLFTIAEDMGLLDPLVAAFQAYTVVAAIGPVCAEALRQVGVVPDVLPGTLRMGALITALADYVELTRQAEGTEETEETD